MAYDDKTGPTDPAKGGSITEGETTEPPDDPTYPKYKVIFKHSGGDTKVMEGPHTDVVAVGDAKVGVALSLGLKTPLPSGGSAPSLVITLTRLP
jgi:hypothetical protein